MSNVSLQPFKASSEEFGIRWSDLLGFAIESHAQLLASVPAEVEIWLGQSSKPTEKMAPLPIRTPNVLVLEAEHLIQLRTFRNAVVEHSGHGFSTCSGSDARPLAPSESARKISSEPGDSKYRSHWDLWRAKPKKGAKFEVSIDQVFMFENTFQELVRSYRNGAAHDGSWLSRDLQLMIAAAKYFWASEKVRADDKRTHPLNDDVAKWLVDREMSPSRASEAASLIRPSYAPGGQREK